MSLKSPGKFLRVDRVVMESTVETITIKTAL